MSDNEIEDVSFLPGESLHRRAIYEPNVIRRVALLFCTKTRAAVIGVLICLVVVVIALIAALSNNNGGNGDGTNPTKVSGCNDDDSQNSGTNKGGNSTTKTDVQDYISTNGKPFPWKDVRLPRNILPIHYNLYLHPNITESTFSGSVNILCEVKADASFFIFHIKDLTIKKIEVKLSTTKPNGDTEPREVLETDGYLEYKGNEQIYVKMASGAELKKGSKVNVIVEFSGALIAQLSGFYKSMYKTSDGEKRYIAASQFEPTSARKAFPCFDEPDMKASFQLTMIREKSNIALFNMPLTKTTDFDGGLEKDEFSTSVKMSTYLVAFVVCDYKSVTDKTKRNVTVRVFTPPEFISSADFALKSAVKIIDNYEQFFAVNFPLPKLDLIAIPDFEAGAMENWGLITYRMADILYDPKVASMTNKQRIGVVVAHELAHQWFGNLVTLKWWNDLWLNEGFASYVEYIGTDIVNPDWHMMDQFIPTTLQNALFRDSLGTSHPINQPVHDPGQINELFDAISYDKGASIIRMLKNYLGDENFKKGITAYLNKYKYANAETIDLWQSLSEAVKGDSAKNVTSLMQTWTEQMGYPVVTINRQGNTLTVSQERFLLSTSEKAATNDDSPFGYKWQIPFCYTTSVNSDGTTVLMKDRQVTLTIEQNVPETGWVKGNCGVNGYYRVNYDENNWKAIIAQLNKADYKKMFTPTDRAEFIDDAFILARAGQLSYKTALDLTIYLTNENDFIPWSVYFANINFLWKRLESKPIFSKFKAYMLKVLTTQLSTVTWDDVGSDLDKYLRSAVLSWAISLGHEDSVNKGKELFKEWRDNQESVILNVNLKNVIYKVGITSGNDKNWDFMWNLYITAQDDNEKNKILSALGKTKDASLISRLLGYSLDETFVRSQDTVTVISAVTGTYTGQLLAWRFVQKNWDKFFERYGVASFTMAKLIKITCSNFDTQFDYDEIKTFFSTRNAGSGERAVQQVLEKIQANMLWTQKYEADVIDWIKAKSGG